MKKVMQKPMYRSEIAADGSEVCDPRPIEVPLHMKAPESITDMIRRLVRTEVSGAAVERGAESFEESNDFDVDDDDFFDPVSPYEDRIQVPPVVDADPGEPEGGGLDEVEKGDTKQSPPAGGEPAGGGKKEVETVKSASGTDK